jgi:hypothetical protein
MPPYPPMLKSMGPSSLQSVTNAHKIQDSKDSPTRLKGFAHKIQRSYIISKRVYNDMEKNPDKNFTTVEVDPASDEYCVKIPEWIINEMGWYEGTEIQWIVDGDEIYLREV